MQVAMIKCAMPCAGKESITKDEFIEWLKEQDKDILWERHSPIYMDGEIIGRCRTDNVLYITD